MGTHNRYYQQVSGPGHVPSYQISGIPYVTASFEVPAHGGTPTEIGFPNVTKWLTVENTYTGSNLPADLRVGFSANGAEGGSDPAGLDANYLRIHAGDSFTGEWRVESIYLIADTAGRPASASVIAGLTGIPIGSIPGRAVGTTSWSGSVGVG